MRQSGVRNFVGAVKPLVSIIIPAYNAERWIAETITSAVSQTWARKEIIIVDDGSSDRTLAVARRFESTLSVKVITQENQGASAARNNAFKLCQGDYIQWLDADDLLAPEKVAAQMQEAERVNDKRSLLSAAWGAFIYRVSKAQFRRSPLWADLAPVEWLIRKMGQNLHMQTATWLVSRELTEAAGPWDTRLSLDDDGEYFCRVLLASKNVRFVPGAQVYYRASGPHSLSSVSRSDKKLESQFLSMQLHIQYLRALEDSERVRAACMGYLQTWLMYFLPERPDLALELEQIAQSMGGALEPPQLGSKFKRIENVAGYNIGKQCQFYFRKLKWSFIRTRERALHQCEKVFGRAGVTRRHLLARNRS
jgi:glycosyltransferase involved in cell wall biosynthesis